MLLYSRSYPNNDGNSHDTDTTNNNNEYNHDKTKSDANNRDMHAANGNGITKILQVNSSNSNWASKQPEFLRTILENDASITIV